MEYKVLVKLFVPEIENAYELYIPINKTIGEITISLRQLIDRISNGVFPESARIRLYNRHTGTVYDWGLLIRSTDIGNGTELVMISQPAVSTS